MEPYLTESSLIADIVKEFKATGNFDQLRKEYYSEITSQVSTKLNTPQVRIKIFINFVYLNPFQQSFQNLNKSIESFINNLLNDKRQNNNLRKNDLRDLVKRKLYE